MATVVDTSVGKVIKALKAKGMYNNSVIVFTTDNGGPAAGLDGNSACNFPLRGMKTTLWEGWLMKKNIVSYVVVFSHAIVHFVKNKSALNRESTKKQA